MSEENDDFRQNQINKYLNSYGDVTKRVGYASALIVSVVAEIVIDKFELLAGVQKSVIIPIAIIIGALIGESLTHLIMRQYALRVEKNDINNAIDKIDIKYNALAERIEKNEIQLLAEIESCKNDELLLELTQSLKDNRIKRRKIRMTRLEEIERINIS